MEQEPRSLGRDEQNKLVASLRIVGERCQEKNWTVFSERIREALYQANLGLEPNNLEKIRPLMKSILGYDPFERGTRPKGEKQSALKRVITE